MQSSGQTSNKKPITHRRIKKDITTEFICGDKTCGKAYGSSAALYTHVKTKHDGIEPEGTIRPDQSGTKGQKGRPKEKGQPVAQLQQLATEQVSCKICLKKECRCPEKFDRDLIDVLRQEQFINFINDIGNLGQNPKTFTTQWARNIDSDFVQRTPQEIKKSFKEFCRANDKEFHYATISDKLVKYLNVSSKFWAQQKMDELYQGIFVIAGKGSAAEARKFIEKNEDMKLFAELIRCNEKHFDQLCEVIFSLSGSQEIKL